METQTSALEQSIGNMPCLCAALRSATRAVTRLYNEEVRRTGIEVTQYTLLRVLASAGPLNQVQLGEVLAADKTTMSRNLRLLKSKGWVTAHAGADRRARALQITGPGRQQLARALPAWQHAQARIRCALTGPRFDRLRALLRAATEAAQRAS